MEMENFYQRFCKEGFDENGVLNYFEPLPADNFNFAYDVVDEIARLDPNRRALVWCNVAGEERVFTFREMKYYSDCCAQMLTAHGIKKGDMVLLVLKRHYEFWFTVLALHKIGAVGVPATNLLTTHDLVYRFKAAGITACICSGEHCKVPEYVDEAIREYPDIHTKFIVRGQREGWLNYTEELKKFDGRWERVPTSKDDPMLLYFTSGTTGMPKMAVHSMAYPLAHIITARYWHNVHENDLHLTVSETGWMKAVWGKLYGQWLACASIFVYDFDKFVPGDLLHMMEKYKVTTFCAPPTIYRFFIKEGMEGYNLSSLRYSTTAGEALNPEVYNRWFEYTGLRLMECYGQTETVMQVANLVGMQPKPGSMGKPSPLYDIHLVDEDGYDVPTGVTGEIVINTEKPHPGLFGGYFRNQEATDAAWHDGYYHTGDTAWRDEDGYLWYVGRTDDVIKSSGYRIGPFEIESVLMEHPAVLECAVTGAPDPVRGIVVKATIVLTSSYQPSEELKKEIQTFVKKQTAPYKYPRIVEFVTELPKTISGKIRRTEIRAKDRQNAQNSR
ncbi:MAG TPA: AMP-binding protein [Candidatus Anaerotruncus excrementipullorum]|uniref:AMP-binding protein n=1 Tax=Candidatus Anaerotruncus excrementipullorum TaxID=2838465 RepID=A0A9D1WRY7_9FIRM|nr:AMP-binding protein [Candidatus Anaerotruncus excrementipullorum]